MAVGCAAVLLLHTRHIAGHSLWRQRGANGDENTEADARVFAACRTRCMPTGWRAKTSVEVAVGCTSRIRVPESLHMEMEGGRTGCRSLGLSLATAVVVGRAIDSLLQRGLGTPEEMVAVRVATTK